MKKDSIIRLARLFLGGALFTYAAVLYNTNTIVAVENKSQILLAIVAFVGLMILAMGIFMICIKKARILQFIFGVAVVFFAAYSGLIDNPTTHVYLQDILYILGSVMLVAGPAGWCVPNLCKEKQEEEEIEIIEV